MPSPPPAVRSSHHATAAASLAGSARSTSTLAVARNVSGSAAGEPAADVHVPRVRRQRVHGALTGEDLERCERDAFESVDGPAVLPVRVDEALGHGRAAPRHRDASGAASSRRRAVAASTAFSARSVAVAAAPTDAYCVRRSSSALADHGRSSQSSTAQSVASSSQSPAVVNALRTRSRSWASTVASVKNARPVRV